MISDGTAPKSDPTRWAFLDTETTGLAGGSGTCAKDVLLEALAEFTGTVVFVSHDRYFIDKLATRVFEIGGGEVHVFPGNYEDYLWRKSGKPLDIPLVDAPAMDAPPAASEPEKPAKRVNPMKVQKLKERCGSIEGDIARTEAEIASLESQLSDFKSAEDSLRVVRQLDESRAKLDRLMAQWEEVSASIEAGG